ncbi:MAG: Arc family DNA-binding protein [Saprospiraceae bacterium]
MPTLQIRDLPQDIYDKLVESAELNRRSLTQEAITILEQKLNEQSEIEAYNLRKRQILAERKEISQYLTGFSTEDIVNMVREDRDR